MAKEVPFKAYARHRRFVVELEVFRPLTTCPEALLRFARAVVSLCVGLLKAALHFAPQFMPVCGATRPSSGAPGNVSANASVIACFRIAAA
jgi:hypothetical protein